MRMFIVALVFSSGVFASERFYSFGKDIKGFYGINAETCKAYNYYSAYGDLRLARIELERDSINIFIEEEPGTSYVPADSIHLKTSKFVSSANISEKLKTLDNELSIEFIQETGEVQITKEILNMFGDNKKERCKLIPIIE